MLPIICVFIVFALTSAAPQGSDLVNFPNLPDGLVPAGVTPPAGIGEIGQIGQLGQMEGMFSQLPDANAVGGMITQPPGIANINEMMSTPPAMGGIMSQVPSNQIPLCGGGSASEPTENDSEPEPETLPSDTHIITA